VASGSNKDAIIAWEGDSKEVLSSFPDAAKRNLGFDLRLLQHGQQPTDYRPMSSIGSGVFELRDQDGRAWYRVICLSRVKDVIHVLHCFEKGSRETPMKDIHTARQRLKEVRARMMRERKYGNEHSRPTHVTRGNVLDDLGFSPEQATILKFKADLYQTILKHARKYSQKQLQVILAEPQPRVSELLNGKIANKSVDKLLYYAGRLGIEAKTKFSQTNRQVVRRQLAAAAR